MGVLVQILQGTQLLGLITVETVKLANIIKALFAPLGPDIQVNIMQLGDTAITANTDTIESVNAFLAEKGLPALQLQQPAQAAAPASSGEITGGTPPTAPVTS